MKRINRVLVADYGLYRVWFEEDKRLILEVGFMHTLHLRLNINAFWHDIAEWKTR